MPEQVWNKWYSERRGRYYYHNEATGEVQWSEPKGEGHVIHDATVDQSAATPSKESSSGSGSSSSSSSPSASSTNAASQLPAAGGGGVAAARSLSSSASAPAVSAGGGGSLGGDDGDDGSSAGSPSPLRQTSNSSGSGLGGGGGGLPRKESFALASAAADASATAPTSSETVGLLQSLFPYYSYDANTARLVNMTIAQVPTAEIDGRDEHGNSLLLLAIQCKAHDTMERLIDMGADVNARNVSGSCALHYACHYETFDADTVRLLVNKVRSTRKASLGATCLPWPYLRRLIALLFWALSAMD